MTAARARIVHLVVALVATLALVLQTALVGITVTGLVHFVLLRPLLDLEGASQVADTLLHLVVPVLAAWLAAGPRPRTAWRTAAEAVLWPLAWLGYTVAVGVATGWHPYPFLDHREAGAGGVVAVSAGILVLFVVLFAVVIAVDRRLRPVPDADR